MAQSDPPGPRAKRSSGAKGGTILIADDDEFFRVALRSILTKTFASDTVIEASSLDEALERLTETENVSLVLLDLAMPGMESAASVRAVRECLPAVQVAVISASRRRSDILLALEAGAHGYIPKGLGVAELTAALKTIRSGTVYVPASLTDLRDDEEETQRLGMRSPPAQPQEQGPTLSPRQSEVMALLMKGLSNREIGQALGLGQGTVKVHVAAVFRGLGVTSRAGVAAAAARLFKRAPNP